MAIQNGETTEDKVSVISPDSYDVDTPKIQTEGRIASLRISGVDGTEIGSGKNAEYFRNGLIGIFGGEEVETTVTGQDPFKRNLGNMKVDGVDWRHLLLEVGASENWGKYGFDSSDTVEDERYKWYAGKTQSTNIEAYELLESGIEPSEIISDAEFNRIELLRKSLKTHLADANEGVLDKEDAQAVAKELMADQDKLSAAQKRRWYELARNTNIGAGMLAAWRDPWGRTTIEEGNRTRTLDVGIRADTSYWGFAKNAYEQQFSESVAHEKVGLMNDTSVWNVTNNNIKSLDKYIQDNDVAPEVAAKMYDTFEEDGFQAAIIEATKTRIGDETVGQAQAVDKMPMSAKYVAKLLVNEALPYVVDPTSWVAGAAASKAAAKITYSKVASPLVSKMMQGATIGSATGLSESFVFTANNYKDFSNEELLKTWAIDAGFGGAFGAVLAAAGHGIKAYGSRAKGKAAGEGVDELDIVTSPEDVARRVAEKEAAATEQTDEAIQALKERDAEWDANLATKLEKDGNSPEEIADILEKVKVSRNRTRTEKGQLTYADEPVNEIIAAEDFAKEVDAVKVRQREMQDEIATELQTGQAPTQKPDKYRGIQDTEMAMPREELKVHIDEMTMNTAKVMDAGDDFNSPWLFNDGSIVSTSGDHIDLSFRYGLQGYRDMSLESGAIRSMFHVNKGVVEEGDPKSFVSLQLFDDQQMTPEQFKLVEEFVNKNDAKILLGIDRSGANTPHTPPEEVTLQELQEAVFKAKEYNVTEPYPGTITVDVDPPAEIPKPQPKLEATKTEPTVKEGEAKPTESPEDTPDTRTPEEIEADEQAWQDASVEVALEHQNNVVKPALEQINKSHNWLAKLHRMLGKSIGMQDFTSRMIFSKDAKMSFVGSRILESGVGFTGKLLRKASAALVKDSIYTRNIGNLNKAYTDNIAAWAMEQGSSRYQAWKSAWEGGKVNEVAQQFHREVFKHQEMLQMGKTPTPNKYVAEYVKVLNKINDELFQGRIDANIKGFDKARRIANYIPHVWKKVKVERIIDQHGEDVVRELLAKSIESAKRQGKISSAESTTDLVDRQLNWINGIGESLEHGGNGIGDGISARGKSRVPLDFSVEHNGLHMVDLIDTDLPTVMDSYIQRAGADIGISQATNGLIRSEGDFVKYLTPDDPKDQQLVKDAMDMLYGRPTREGMSPELRSMMDLVTIQQMGGIGVAQLAETGTMAQRLIVNYISQPQIAKKLWAAASADINDKGILHQIRSIAAVNDNMEYINRYSVNNIDQAQIDELSDMRAASIDAVDKLTLGAYKAQFGRMLGKFSGVHAVQKAQSRLLQTSFSIDVARAAKFNKGTSTTERLADLGLAYDGKAFDNIRKHVEFDEDGFPTNFNFDKWDKDALDTFVHAMNREEAQLMPRVMSGELPVFMNKPLWQAIMQFRKTPLAFMSKGAQRNLQFADREAVFGTVLNSLTAGVVRYAKVAAGAGAYVALSDAEFQDPTFDQMQPYNYVSNFGILGDAYSLSRNWSQAYQQKDGLESLWEGAQVVPTLSALDNAYNAVDGDPSDIKKAIPLNTLPLINEVSNAVIRNMEQN